MFGRNNPPDQKPPPQANPQTPPTPQQAPAPQAAPRPAAASTSVIGADLSIVGQKIHVVSQSRVQVDGHIEGDIAGREVVIGEAGIVTGTVTANSVEVRGALHGAVNASNVALLQTAHVEGDINHQTLTIAEGARFDGRVRRPQDASSLEPNLDVASLSQSAKS